MRLKFLRQRRAELTAEADGIFKAAEAASRALTEAEKVRDDAIAAELLAINDEITRLERQQERAGALGAVPSTGATRVEVGAPNLASDPKRGFEHMGTFAQAVQGMSAPGPRIDQRLVDGGLVASSGLPTTYQQEHDGAEGILVPPHFRQEIWKAVYTPDSLLERLTFEPTSSPLVEFNADEATPWGAQGVKAYWPDEGGLLTESKDEALRKRVVKAHDLFAFVAATNQVLEDAPRLNARLTQKAPEAIRWKLLEAVVRGNGVARPLGWMNANNASRIVIDKEGGQGANTLKVKNLTKMMARLYMLSGNHFWLGNQGLLPELVELMIGTQPAWTPMNAGLKDAPGGRLLGAALYWSEQASPVGQEGDLQLIDPAGYYGLQRGALKYDVSIHLLFDRNMTAFRWGIRVGGTPFLTKPVEVPRSDSRSTFVILGARQ